MGEILVGTSSWADKSLIACGKFYPPHVNTAEERLRYYAEHFPLVQVDSAWYALPQENTARLWAERTPEQFVFDIKLFRLFTRHQTPINSLPPDLRRTLPEPVMRKDIVYYDDVPPEVRQELWQRYVSAVLPLRAAGKLGTVLVQMAPWVLPGGKAIAHLEECRRQLGALPASVEFRNAAWFTEGQRQRTLDFLTAHDYTHVVVDEPQGFKNSVPLVPAVTLPSLAYLRLHGRNRATWSQKGLESTADRFNYEYSADELGEIVPVARGLAERAATVHVLFNNNYQDQGQRNAQLLRQLLLTPAMDQRARQ